MPDHDRTETDSTEPTIPPPEPRPEDTPHDDRTEGEKQAEADLLKSTGGDPLTQEG